MFSPNARSIYACPHGAIIHPTLVAIPPITDTIGKSWKQPDLTNIDVSGETVELTQQEFDGLLEYSTTSPSGVYPGKCWKAEGMDWPDGGGHPKPNGIWYLRWFGIVPDNPKVCSNNQRIIKFINQRKEEPK